MPLLKKGNKEKLEQFAHILAGFIILLHAYEKYELHESSYTFFAVAGIVFLSIAIMHHRISKIFPYVDGVFFIIEAIVYSVVAADYFHLGKKGLPWAYIFAAIAYVAAAFVKAKRGKAKHIHTSETKNIKK